MNRNILLIISSLLFFLFVNSVNAQILSAGFLSQGNYSRIRNIENVRRLAYGVGGFLEIKLKDNWRIAPQIFYNQIGGNIGEVRPDVIPLKLHYIENQYSLSYIFEGNYWHYQVTGAVSAAYLWKAKYDTNPSFDLRWATHDFDVGWLAGFGFRYETGGWKWFSAEFRHYWGRNSVFLDRFGFPVRNSVFSLRLAYTFPLKMR
ncbi:hypothetical protein Fleli_0861 [Bernardetia litoralis DSM 6794]|uniref:Outer membrane protein beta-barrel domain-containing protein n=1 Tax=Bernardetia litoralis (strain ATCC 23117 / DSM 6794 / NBRC 15988 / NCIMB 1366 / Fx l1 / Sio-4) TaxID=880071 RepID=I4AH83_BERLS|nr:outer membrane beta-barrel protein [Bernardetia litoralis]AFM03318.1 hypothetical protein Fleli_0861 [Bernardetia litoralis DSM 6794]